MNTKKNDDEIIQNQDQQIEFKFPNLASEITFLRTYSQTKPNGDKETWRETITRYFDYLKERFGDRIDPVLMDKAFKAVLAGKVMPSMRLLQYAGPIIGKFEATVYNCSYTDIDSIEAFSEVLYLNLIGVGVGFGLNRVCTDKLPVVSIQKKINPIPVVVEDSTQGWVRAYHLCMTLWFAGYDTEVDTSNVRKKGSKISNRGYSAGRESLDLLLEKCRTKILGAQGRRLRPIELYDILCYGSYHVSASGPRRVAAISFSDHDDLEMRHAKKGEFWVDNPQRTVCNNSIRYYSKPTWEEFLADWNALKSSGTGERGIFNISRLVKDDGINRRKWPTGIYPGTNACGEIKLRSCQFCNLSEVVVRPEDTIEDLLEKIEIATLIGTWQSMFTEFDTDMLRPEWRINCEEERLLGVSLTGVLDNHLFHQGDETDNILKRLREKAVEVNLRESRRLGINQSAAITCCKPSGTVSLVMNTASGIHARFARYYIRRIRFNKYDQILKRLECLGVPVFVAPENEDHRYIEIPIKSPDESVLMSDLSAVEQMRIWQRFKIHYTEHNPSYTCQVKQNEWDGLGEWVYGQLDHIVGVSFLPTAHLYKAAPIEEISQEIYQAMYNKLRSVDLSDLYKNEDFHELVMGCDKSMY